MFMVTWVRMQQNSDVKGTSIFRSDKLIVGEEQQSVLMTAFCLKTRASFKNKRELFFFFASFLFLFLIKLSNLKLKVLLFLSTLRSEA